MGHDGTLYTLQDMTGGGGASAATRVTAHFVAVSICVKQKFPQDLDQLAKQNQQQQHRQNKTQISSEQMKSDFQKPFIKVEI